MSPWYLSDVANLINILYEHEGTKFDLQAEDMGAAKGELDVRIYRDGAIIFQKHISYRGQVPDGANPLEHDQAVRAIMVRHIETLKKGIATGKVR